MRAGFLFACLGVLLACGSALAGGSRVRAAGPVQHIAPQVTAGEDGFAPETPRFCLLPNSGKILAVWQADRISLQGLRDPGIWWRYFTHDLQPLNDPVPVGPDTLEFRERRELFPSCIATDDGFALVWEHRNDTFGDAADIWGQFFYADGTPATDRLVLNSETSVEEYLAGIVRTDDGNLLVVWSSWDSDFFRERLFKRSFSMSGQALGYDEFLVGSGESTDPNRSRVQVASLGATTLAAWSEYVPGVGGADGTVHVLARTLDSDGSGSSPATISEGAGERHSCKDVAASDDGGVVLWVSAKRILRARGVGTDGQPVGPAVTINEVTDGFIADGPVVRAAPDGSSYLVVWGVHGAEDEEVLRAQLLDSGAQPVGPPYRIEFLDNGGGYLNRLRWPGLVYVSPHTAVVGWEYFHQPPGWVHYIEAHIQLLKIGNIEQECGDIDDDGFATAGDALGVLQVAVGLRDCQECYCDVNGSGNINVLDALTVLRASVDLPPALRCPVCEVPS